MYKFGNVERKQLILPLTCITLSTAIILALVLLQKPALLLTDLAPHVMTRGTPPSKLPEDLQESHINTLKTPALSEEATLRGLDYFHLQQSHGVTGLDEGTGSGICILDINNDHNPDLFVVGGSGQTHFYGRESWWTKKQGSRLYENDGHGFFTDVTDRSGIQLDVWGMGCSSADLDGDGLVDLIVTARHSAYLLHNLGNGHFDRTQLFQNERSWPTTVAIADINNDGLPDIYIANYLRYEKTAKRFEGISGYRRAAPETFRSDFYQGQKNLLFVNKGKLEFRESAKQLNLAVSEGRSLSAHWFYANNDAFIDLLIVNDTGSTTQLYLNRGGLRFDKADLSRHLDLPSGTRDASINDLDGDGDADIVLSTPIGEPPVLLENTGSNYTNVTWDKLENASKLTGTSTFAVSALDINNDGYLDILFNNGLPTPDEDSPYVTQGQSNQIALNDGNGEFISWKPARSPFSDTLSSRSVAVADFDNDGDQDLAISNNNGPLQLFINSSDNNQWIGFDFSQEDYLKAKKVELTTDSRTISRFIDRSSFLGNQSSRISIYLKNDEKIISASIHWGDDSVSIERNPTPLNYHIIRAQKFSSSYQPKHNQKSRELPFHLAYWEIIGDKNDSHAITENFPLYNTTQKQALLEAIGNHHPRSHLATIKIALEDQTPSISRQAIGLLVDTEDDNALHWLEPMFESSDIETLCALAEGYKHLYIEEEAAILRKNLAVTKLIHLLENKSPRVQKCTLEALAESKSFRPVHPVMQLISQTKNKEVIKSAYYALGELRRSHSTMPITGELAHDRDLEESHELAMEKSSGSLVPIKAESLQLDLNNTHYIPHNEGIDRASCINTETEKLKRLHKKQLASLFNLCSKSQIKNWLHENIAFITSNYNLFLDNPWISDAAIDSLLQVISKSPPAGFVDFLHTRIKKQDKRIDILLSNLREYDLDDNIYETLISIFTDKTQNKETRIKAGDILIHRNSDLVLSHSESLFYE